MRKCTYGTHQLVGSYFDGLVVGISAYIAGFLNSKSFSFRFIVMNKPIAQKINEKKGPLGEGGYQWVNGLASNAAATAWL